MAQSRVKRGSVDLMPDPPANIAARLSDLPQVRAISHAARVLDRRQDVYAVWLGGSFARGEADRFSDVDMRIAVGRDHLAAWQEPDWPELFGEAAVGHQLLRFAETSFLHHLILSRGTIIDFFVQSLDHPLSGDAQLIISCDDAALAERIRAADQPQPTQLPEASPQQLKAAIEEFWITSHKHAKVLYRKLDVMALTGVERERALLMRLWYAWLTGKDLGGQRPTIHLFSQVARSLQAQLGPKALSVLGASLATRRDILGWIRLVRDEVGSVGRSLAAAHGFAYPQELEQTVRRCWTADEPLLDGADETP